MSIVNEIYTEISLYEKYLNTIRPRCTEPEGIKLCKICEKDIDEFRALMSTIETYSMTERMEILTMLRIQNDKLANIISNFDTTY